MGEVETESERILGSTLQSHKMEKSTVPSDKMGEAPNIWTEDPQREEYLLGYTISYELKWG